MLGYFKQVWLANRAVGWMILLNLALLVFISSSFTGYFPDANNGLEAAYQIGFLPSIWGLYGILIFLVLLPFTFIPRSAIPLAFLVAILGGTLGVMIYIDSFIYDIFNFHINLFFIRAFWADEGGEFFDVSIKTYVQFTLVALLVTAFQLGVLWLVFKKIVGRKRYPFLGLASGVGMVAVVLAVNITHSWAYAQNYSPITSLNAHVPFHFPIHSRSLKENSLLAGLTSDGDGEEQAGTDSIYYPRQPMQCSAEKNPNIIMVVLESWRGDKLTKEITPNMHALALKSLWFKEHHSGGTVTTKGVFSMMYGLAPTYMDNVVANNGAGGPVLLNVLKDKGYDFGVFPSGDITRIKLSDSAFLPVKDSIEHGEGSNTIEKDYDVFNRMTKLMSERKEDKQPFYGFLFFNSTHYLYYYPEEFKKFSPVDEPSLVDFKSGKDPEPFKNRYKNSLYFVDSLIGDLEKKLKENGQWDNTILVITSDHAEEFADTAPTRFGHGSNFTRHQTHVPLIIHWPNKQAKAYEHITAGVDIIPTLLQDGLGCENDFSDYTNGENLTIEESRDVQVIASYYNYALVTPEGSFIQNPYGLLDSKNNMDQKDSSLELDPKKTFYALDQMKLFYEPVVTE